MMFHQKHIRRRTLYSTSGGQVYIRLCLPFKTLTDNSLFHGIANERTKEETYLSLCRKNPRNNSSSSPPENESETARVSTPRFTKKYSLGHKSLNMVAICKVLPYQVDSSLLVSHDMPHFCVQIECQWNSSITFLSTRNYQTKMLFKKFNNKYSKSLPIIY